ncbi:MAG: C39 family peptidase [Desulfobulbaceae bacterium]|nr:C39 family peptidase [Desulfobulbaceae bacterium]HIJ79103.1 hypothetical protein [Deltaproteobacteria bacterium]
MKQSLDLKILNQPDDTTCGPTCLHAVYQYYGDNIGLDEVVTQVKSFEGGGTLAVFLACHALARGYNATIYTYNVQVFDPTWFPMDPLRLKERLLQQAAAKQDAKLSEATKGYVNFLDMGGVLRFEDLTPSLLRKYLKRGTPVLTGLSSTYLYRSMREYGVACDDDDIRGVPAGHFVVLSGYNKEDRTISVADPLKSNPLTGEHYYLESIDTVICSILLGIVTYDSNFLLITPGKKTGRAAGNQSQ